MLSQSEKQFLFTIARTSIEAVVSNERVETLRSIPRALREPCGAFVTLRSTGELRGCIGYVDAIKPLFETVQDAAVKAAAEDFRFEPITAAELPELEMEISILSPRKLIHNIREVEIGRDGLVVELENARGLLLPQVATEQGWDRETFYYETLRKAGIPPSARDHPGIRIFTFTAEVIHQNAPAHHTH
ncbi:MAG TPA: AmmeMemoRadiSam system protein A [Bacteroidota bacterium]|nr:AmmeMemoRadiSam system protein A [Bacteroidota bacterium]